MCGCTFLYPFVFRLVPVDYNLIKKRLLETLKDSIRYRAEISRAAQKSVDKDQNYTPQNSSSPTNILTLKNPSHDFLRLTPGRARAVHVFEFFEDRERRRFGMKLKTQSELSKVWKNEE